ncbi:MAG: polyprenyl synthetase family protein [Hyphomicrobiaceae bacterium]|nr:polyprenyl synthetase family protein [Hyphomicrobiaceae bacterium]
MHPFAAQLATAARIVEARLGDIITREAARGAPPRLVDATRHAVLGGGKRFRPFLVFESAALFGLSAEDAVDAAAAIECIHCYSLVHDDLPDMDNDALRRGQPTVWKAYDTWTAILTGDGLQAMAFELLSAPSTHANALTRTELVRVLALASGNAGMVGGQALDLEAERLHADARPDIAHITRLQAMKTGALIRAACEMGAVLGQASHDERAALIRFGGALGFAFQISDDLLDAEGSAADVGKATGKDAAAGKATLVSLLGLKAARAHLDETVASAIAALEPFGARADVLIEAAKFMGRRER